MLIVTWSWKDRVTNKTDRTPATVKMTIYLSIKGVNRHKDLQFFFVKKEKERKKQVLILKCILVEPGLI